MKAIKIDCEKQQVYEVELDKKNLLKSMYAEMNCDLVDKVSINTDNDLVIDEEGLLKEDNGAFDLLGYQFRGTALVVGYDGEGNWIDTTLSVEKIRAVVIFDTKFANV